MQGCSQKLGTFLGSANLILGTRLSRVRIGDEENYPEVGCETGEVRNVGVGVWAKKNGEGVSAAMLNCLRELKNPKGKETWHGRKFS